MQKRKKNAVKYINDVCILYFVYNMRKICMNSSTGRLKKEDSDFSE